MRQNSARRGITLFLVRLGLAGMLIAALALSLALNFTPVAAATNCGDGAAPDYGFTYNLQQPHWTVNWENHISEQTVNEVDAILDRLNSDSIAQTMILILPPEQVGIRVNCAVHFLRYMKLGLPSGERQDNGFVFLIVVEPTRIDVHYGVGLGLPALTAPELTALNRTAEDTYQTTHSLDQAVLALVQGFDTTARGKYAPLASSAASTSESNSGPISGPSNGNQQPSGPMDYVALCGQLCLGLVVVMFMLFGARRGIRFGGGGFGGGGFGGGFGGGGFGGGGGGGSSSRGGSGGGRSGRGN